MKKIWRIQIVKVMKIELKKAEGETIFDVVFQQCYIIELRVQSIALSTIYYFFDIWVFKRIHCLIWSLLQTDWFIKSMFIHKNLAD